MAETYPDRTGTAGIAITVSGLDRVEEAFDRGVREILTRVGESLHRSAEDVMGDSKENYVPVMDGILRGSGHVELPKAEAGEVTVELGYGGPAAPYALAVHENPRAGKTGGVGPQGQQYKKWAKVGQWKYLETPLKKHTPKIEKKLYTDIEALLRRV